MRLRLSVLRALVAEEVERNNRWSAGMFMAGGVSAARRDREASPVSPPPGLGSHDDADVDDDGTERWSQPGARVRNASGG